MSRRLSPQLASEFAGIALGHLTREYPNKLDHVLAGQDDVLGPRALHPVFYGSFDWHSCVHGYWLLATLYRRFPALARRDEIKALFDQQLVPDKVAGEIAYLARPDSQGFERPYGWAWLLMLAAELRRHRSPEGQAWSAALTPLAEAFAARFRTFLGNAPYPNRTGAHPNTAFALALATEYADAGLMAAISDRARPWYGNDADAQAWEPDGDAFLSPVLVEAECMRRVLPAAEFAAWFVRFLPDLTEERPAALFTPAQVADRADCKIVHLDGLNLSRAWCWRRVAGTLDGPRRNIAIAAAERHLDFSLPEIAGRYVGEHWLASFALLALTAFDEDTC